MEHNSGGLVQMIFLYILGVIFRFQPLIFRGVGIIEEMFFLFAHKLTRRDFFGPTKTVTSSSEPEASDQSASESLGSFDSGMVEILGGSSPRFIQLFLEEIRRENQLRKR